jgi:hypothetical protein
MLVALHGAPEGDPSEFGGEGRLSLSYVELFALLFAVPLWIALAGLLLGPGARGGMPRRAAGGVAGLYLLAAIAAWAGAAIYYGNGGGWSVLVPTVLPLLIAGYAMWVRLPATRGMLREELASALGLGAILATSVAVAPLGMIDEMQRPARAAAFQKKNEAIVAQREAEAAQHDREQREKFARLTADSPLQEHLDYIFSTYGKSPEFEKAVAGARQAKSRQDNALRLLQADKPQLYALKELWRLDIEATPETCRALDGALLKEANAEGFDTNAGEYLEYQLANMTFFVGAGCNLDKSLDAAATRVQKILDAMGNADGGRQRWSEFIDKVAVLRRPH